MSEVSVYDKIKSAVESIQKKSKHTPQVGIILGSGLGPIAEEAGDAVTISYSEIPHFHTTSVQGHAGKMVIGKLSGVPVVFLQGRFHRYEGHPMEEVVFPTRTLARLGIHTLILTNASGGINPKYRAGDIMLIEDHINLMGDNPLTGKNLSELGPRFPDMTEAYSKIGIEILEDSSKSLSMDLKKGVYAGVQGPTYETPAEVRMLRTLGADAVGMSTVPESIAANHLGVRVCGVSIITNLAAGLSPQKLSHEEVMEKSKESVGKVNQLIQKALPRLGVM